MACIKISGTVPVGTTPAVFNLSIDVRAYIKLLGLLAIDTPSNLTYYKIDVKAAPCWPASVSDLDNYGFDMNANVPNPFSESTTLSFNSTKSEKYSLKVYNLLGQEMYQTTFAGFAGENSIKIDASLWSSGTYIYTLSNGRNSRMGKLQVSK